MQNWATLLNCVDEDILGDAGLVERKWRDMSNAMIVNQGKSIIQDYARLNELLNIIGYQASCQEEFVRKRVDLLELLDLDNSYVLPI